jgi:hypothetical protein
MVDWHGFDETSYSMDWRLATATHANAELYWP